MKYWESWRDWWDNDQAAGNEVSGNGGFGQAGTLTRHAWNAATQRAIEIVKRHMDYPSLVRELKRGFDNPRLAVKHDCEFDKCPHKPRA